MPWSGLVVGLLALWWHPTVRALCRGEIDWTGSRVYVPAHTVDPDALAAIDLQHVHASLWPAWVIEAARARRGRPHDEAAAFAALADAVSADPNLHSLLTELRPLVRDRLDVDGRRALYLVWAWSEYLRRARQPYWMQATRAEREHTSVLQLSTYAVRHVTDVAVGVGRYEVQLVERVDDTTLREAYLGATRRGDDFATVVLDRVDDFMIEDVWPLLDDTDDAQLSAMARNWAPALRRELRAALSPEDYETLVATAPQQRRIARVVHDVRARRNCVRQRLLRRVRYDGLPSRRLRHLQAIVERERDRACPSLDPRELEELAIASGKLRARSGLRPAVEALTAFGSRHVVVHEVRHLADAVELGGLDASLPCASCSPAMGAEARAELSGHLAAIAWSDAPALAMFQACLVVARDPSAPHAEAMRLVTTRLGRPCGSPPADDLHELARSLEREMLGRSEPIALPPSYPRRLRDAVADDGP